jgi:hypothetical protein
MLAALLSVLVHGFVDFLFIGSTEFGSAFVILLALSQRAEHLVDSPRARAAASLGLQGRSFAMGANGALAP